MRTMILFLVAACAVGLLVSCEKAEGPEGGPAKGAPVVAAKPGETVLEAETLTLSGCKVAALKGASGGKAVLMMAEGDQVTATVALKKGAYKVVLVMQGESDEEDAVYLTVGAGEKRRMWTSGRGALADAVQMGDEQPFIELKIDKDGPVEVKLEFAEKNVQVDRIVFALQD